MDQLFWENRYKDKQTGWSIGQISTPIKNYLDQLEDKNLKILIPGCGFGFEAKYLHEMGFKDVTILDFAQESLDEFSIQNPNFPKNHILNKDFFSFEVEEEYKFDLIIEQTLFCAINPKDRDKYVEKIYNLLKPTGKLIGLLFNREFPDKNNPPFGGTILEYQTRFEQKFTNCKIESCFNSIPQRENTEVFIKISNL